MAENRPAVVRTWLVSALLVLGTFAVFGRSISLGFINYDDPAFVINNPHLQHGFTAASVPWAFAVGRDYWHPLTWLSLMLDRELFGLDARGYHAVNIAWHALNAVLVFLLARRMTGAFWAAAACAALFAWHPQRVESVTWITERKDVLSGFFALAAMLAYLVFGEVRRAGGGRRRMWLAYAASLFAFSCGVMSKSVVVALPMVLLLLDGWPLRRWDDLGRDTSARAHAGRLVAEKLPFFALSIAAGVFTIATQESAQAFALPLSFDQRAANAVVALMRYLGTFAWPSGLSVLYPHPGDWPVVVIGAAGLATAAITAIACWSWRDRPWLLVGWGWFVAFLLPTLGLLQVGLQSMADRYTYLPIIGIQIAGLELGRQALARARRRGTWIAGAAVAGVLGVLAWRTWAQQGVWRDADTLFGHALRVTRDNYVAHTALALESLSQDRLDDAVRHAEAAVALAPQAALAQDTLGAVRLAQGRVDEAIEAYRRAMAAQPGVISARGDLARILLRQGRVEEAATLFQEILATRPTHVPALLGAADVALSRGHADQALTHLLRAQELAPRDAGVAMRVAAVQVAAGRRDAAAATLQLAGKLEPDNPVLQRDVGDALGQLGHFEEARMVYEHAVALTPDDAATHARLGYVYVLLQRPADAIRSWETAKRLDPKMTELDQRIRQARGMQPGTP